VSGPDARVVLSVRDLAVELHGDAAPVRAVDGIGFDLHAGEVLALVGESGSGKSKTAEALLGLIDAPFGTVTAQRIRLDGAELHGLGEAALRRIRGRDISMVFQEPLTALDPVFRCGDQLSAVYRRHRGQGRRQARQSARAMLGRVGFADPEQVMRSYPHQLSGGMRQRVVIAMAMACRPRVLVADEPTTALDVTTQARVLAQLIGLAREAGTAILLITHDLGIVAQYCERALVMRNGRLLEDAAVTDLFRAPASAYTARLIAASRGADA
jgi:ABC-type dipeptide/oligopeptide/nickel transport system ATPase component